MSIMTLQPQKRRGAPLTRPANDHWDDGPGVRDIEDMARRIALSRALDSQPPGRAPGARDTHLHTRMDLTRLLITTVELVPGSGGFMAPGLKRHLCRQVTEEAERLIAETKRLPAMEAEAVRLIEDCCRLCRRTADLATA